MSNKNLIPIKKLNPFGKFCCTIGNLPTSYMLSLTYEEQLLWLCDYLENTVIPAINNNAEAVAEIQDLFIQLKSYVDNYFNNLDVQNEINNKLDKMAEDGTLNRIINQEIFGQINADIAQLKKDINNKNTIFIGDSYGAVKNSWIEQVATKMGLIKNQSYWKFARGGYGFARTNQQWIDLLKEEENIIEDKSSIKYMIICGGLNDTNAQNQKQILTAITLFTRYVNQNYPNCQIYIGCIGWHESSGNPNLRNEVLSKVLPAYQNCAQNANAVYLSGVEYVMHYYGLFGDDASHPSDIGQIYLANAIYQSFITGNFNFNTTIVTTNSSTGVFIEQQIISNHLLCRLYGSIAQGTVDTTTTGNKIIDLGEINPSYIRKVNNSSQMHCTLLVNFGHNNFQVIPSKIKINTSNHHLQIEFYNTNPVQYEDISILDSFCYYNLLVF